MEREKVLVGLDGKGELMLLKNKKTGEIVEFNQAWLVDNNNISMRIDSLSELNEDWEDYEEDKYYWAITGIKHDGGITKMKNKHNDMTAFDKSIGNYFSSREGAEQAVEKLKAWKRLKDKGFRFVKWKCENRKLWIGFEFDNEAWATETEPDLDLLFGGEE